MATPPRRTMGPGGLVIHRQVGPTGVRRAGSQVDPSSRRFPLWVDLAYREQAPFPPPVVTKPLGPMGLEAVAVREDGAHLGYPGGPPGGEKNDKW